MKKLKKLLKLTLLSTFILSTNFQQIFAAPSDVVLIPDSNFKECINDTLSQSENDTITEGKLASIGSLQCTNRGISQIDGIEHMTQLYSVDLSNNNIEDISGLANASNLSTATISGNKISDISAFKDMQYLNVLYANNNSIRDFSVVSTFMSYNLTNVFANNQLVVLDDLVTTQSTHSFPLAKDIDSVNIPYINSNSYSIPLGSSNDLTNTWYKESEVGDVWWYFGGTVKQNVSRLVDISLTANDFSVKLGSDPSDQDLVDKSGAIALAGDKDNITSKITVLDKSALDINKLGTYKITLYVKDRFDQETQVDVSVSVIPTDIKLSANDFSVPLGTELTDADIVDKSNAAATGGNNGDISTSITVADKSSINKDKPSTYEVTLDVKDSYNQEKQLKINVTILPDDIILLANNFSVPLGTELTDADIIDKSDASALAGDKSDISTSITVADKSNINKDKPGTYEVTLNVEDDYNQTKQLIINVTIQPNNIILTATDFSVALGTELTDADIIDKSGAAATGGDKSDISASITVTDKSNINKDKPGTYEVTLNVKDSYNQEKQIIINVTILPDDIILLANNFSVPLGTELTDADIIDKSGAAATGGDKSDISTSITVADKSNINKDKPGTYEITLNVKDSYNQTKQLIINVTIIPNDIILTSNDFSVALGTELTDQDIIDKSGAAATGGDKSDISTSITVADKSNINKDKPGTYEVTLNVKDDYNQETELVISITVLPVDIILSANNISVNLGTELTDQDILDKSSASATSGDKSDISSSITVADKSSINKDKPGTYEVTLQVKDEYSQEEQIIINVTVLPNDIIFTANDFSVALGTELTDQDILDKSNASATSGDKSDISTSVTVADKSNIDKDMPGTYEVTLLVEDDYNQKKQLIINIAILPDDIVLSANDFSVALGNELTDQDILDKSSASATSGDKSDISASITVIDKSNIDKDKPGTYEVTLFVEDEYEQDAQLIITVTVLPDEVSLVANNFTIDLSTELSDQDILDKSSASATSGDRSDISSSIIVLDKSNLNIDIPGLYEVTLYVEDDYEQETELLISITVLPVDIVLSASGFSVEFNSELSEQEIIDKSSANATGGDMSDITSDIVVDKSLMIIDKPGNYEVILQVEDDYGQDSSISILVTVLPTDIYLEANDFSVEFGSEVTDQVIIDNSGASANSGDLSDITSSIVVLDKSNFNKDIPGSYEITLFVEDEYDQDTQITVSVTVLPAKISLAANNFSVDLNTILSDQDILDKSSAVAIAGDKNDISSNIIVLDKSSLNADKPGIYDVTLFVSDDYNQEIELVISITVLPVEISLTANSFTIDLNTELSDADIINNSSALALAGDNSDISTNIVVLDKSNLVVSKPGIYDVTLFVSDDYNQEAELVISITVLPADISLTANNFTTGLNLELSNTDIIVKSAASATAGDLSDITSNIIVLDRSDLDITRPGTYEVVLKVEDNYSQERSLVIFVTVLTNDIKLSASNFEVPLNTELSDQDILDRSSALATAGDNSDITSNIKVLDKSSYDSSIPGVYEVMLSVVDDYDQEASTSILITVIPSVIMLSATNFSISLGEKLSNLDIINKSSALATSGDNSNISSNITVLNRSNLDVNIPGKYEVVLYVKDDYAQEIEFILEITVLPTKITLEASNFFVNLGTKLSDQDIIDKSFALATSGDRSDITSDIKVLSKSDLDLTKPGIYKIVLYVRDNYNQEKQLDIFITVIPSSDNSGDKLVQTAINFELYSFILLLAILGLARKMI